MVRRLFIWLLIGGLTAVGGGAWQWMHRPQSAPDITLITVRGERFRLADWRGRPILVSFWASDCGPCIKEMPELDRLHAEFAPRGLQLIAVAMDYDLPSRVLALVEAARVPYRVTLDSTGAIAAAFGGVRGVPAAFLIAPDGIIGARWLGPLDFSAVRRRIVGLLGES